MRSPPRIAVVLASLGRAGELAAWTERLLAQTLQPHRVIYSVTSENDLPPVIDRYPTSEVVIGSAGSAIQRNRGMELVLKDCDIVAFFDDDYVPARSTLERIVQFYDANPHVAGANGRLLADGINTCGITRQQAGAMIERYDGEPVDAIKIERRLSGLYGCHMTFRTDAIGDIRFDERLPLYAWQEDRDFAARVRLNGPMVRTNAFAGVHLGVKKGRTSGVRFGYSQIVNPLYLWRKGTMSFGFAFQLMLRNFVNNHVRSLRPEPWVDRIGRARGNWLGIADLIRGKASPLRIFQL